jgi:integrase
MPTHIVGRACDCLVPRFGHEIAEDIKPLDIQRWLKSLHESNGLAWATSKIRGVIRRIYKIGILHEHVAKNPVQHVETRSKSDYKAIDITPAQTHAILKALPSTLHFRLVLTCAATALRASEILALRWSDLLWNEGRIRISKRWAKARMARLKRRRRTDMFRCTRSWPPTCTLRARGRVPLSASVFVADHLRPAAKKAGVRIEDGQSSDFTTFAIHSATGW